MEAKTFEVRDRNTFLPVLAVHMSAGTEGDAYLLRRSRVEWNDVVLTSLKGDGQCQVDPHIWGCRTKTTAHEYIRKNWGDLESGDVVDVEFILGETKAPKVSERGEVVGETY